MCAYYPTWSEAKNLTNWLPTLCLSVCNSPTIHTGIGVLAHAYPPYVSIQTSLYVIPFKAQHTGYCVMGRSS